MTAEDAVPILARMVRELQVDIADLRIQNEYLRQRSQLAADVRWWMEQHTPTEVIEMSQAIV